MNIKEKIKKIAILLGVFLILAVLCSILTLILTKSDDGCIAEIYQNGELLQTIDLSSVKEMQTITITNEDGEWNIIEIRPGEIGVTKASCPDKICVHIGFANDSRLPITCLPNRLVIVLHDKNEANEESITPDIYTY